MSIEYTRDAEIHSVGESIQLSNKPYFGRLPLDIQKKLTNDLEEIFYNTGDQIIKPEDTENDFYIVDHGRVKHESVDAFGNPMVTRVLRNGYFFGHFSLIHGVPHMVSAVALSPVYVFKMKRERFMEHLKMAEFAAIFEDKTVKQADMSERLKYLSFFSLLNDSELAKATEFVKITKLATVTDVFSLQPDSPEILIIALGKMEATRSDDLKLKNISLSKGNFVGPLSNLKNVTIKTTAETTLFTMSKQAMQDLLQKVPRLQAVLARQDVTDHLKAVKLFGKFSPEEQEFLAWLIGHAKFAKGQYIYRQGDAGTRYGIITQGQVEVRILDSEGKKPPTGAQIIKIEPGKRHIFGEKAVFLGQPYPEGIWTTETTELFFIDQADLQYVRRNNPGIDQWFEAEPLVKQSFKYANFKFEGKADNENVVYYCHRHWFKFALGLFTPPPTVQEYTKPITKHLPSTWILAVLGGIAVAALWWISPSLTDAFSFNFYRDFLQGASIYVLIASGLTLSVLTLMLVLWVWWTWNDWRDDYLVITNKRVIQREKVLFLQEYRTEVEIGKIQNVNVSYDFWGRMFGYGDLTIKTAAVTIAFDRFPQPSSIYNWVAGLPLFKIFLNPQANSVYADKILMMMTKEKLGQGAVISRQAALAGLKTALRSEIDTGKLDAWQLAPAAKAPPAKPTYWQRTSQNWTKAWNKFWDKVIPWRYGEYKPDESKGIFVWRKHWFNMFLRTKNWVVGLIGAILLVAFYGYLIGINLFIVALLMLILYTLGKLWWQVADWGNDLYILTNTHVIDIEQDPLFARENKNQAELEKVENVRFNQQGLLAYILDYGDVFIETAAGGNTLTFHYVPQPRKVQSEIFKKKEQSKSAIREKEAKEKSREFTKWFDAYHNVYVNLGR